MVEAPTLPQTITFLTQAVLLLVALLAAGAYARKRSREIADVALMFGSLGFTTLVTWATTASGWAGIKLPGWVASISAIAFLANPYLMLRVVKQFRSVPRWIEATAAGGFAASILYVVYSGITGLTFPPAAGEPGWRVILAGVSVVVLLAYLILAYLYAAYAYLAGAYHSSGVTRRRLNYAATGTGLFGLLFLIAASMLAFPATSPIRLGIQSVLGAVFFLAMISFYLAFAPPRSLRRSWQLLELYDYLRATAGHGVDERAASSTRELKRTAIRLTGARRAAIVEIRGDRWNATVLHANGDRQILDGAVVPGGVLDRVRATGRTVIERARPVDTSGALAAGLKGGAAENAVGIPLASNDQVWRVLTFPLERVPYFIDEAVEILEILASQAASALETQAFAHEQEDIRIREARLAAEELRRQNFAMQEASRLKSEFLANMSHELRTPLNGIIGFADLMASGKVGPVNPDHDEFVRDILTSARHLLQLINDVLDLAKVEAGRMEFHPERLDAATVLEETLAVVRPLAQKKSIALQLDVDPQVRELTLDPVRLKQIAYNYVSNAIKFTPDGGRVTIRVMPEAADKFRIEVEDTGVGIAPNDVPRLFHEFQQLDAGMAKHHQGTGLGLALVRRLAEAQGGSVGVRSALGTGSVFHAILPRHLDAKQPLQPSGEPVISASPRVLVVDDDENDRGVIAQALRAQGYQVETAGNGRDALALIRAREFDAATIDLILPDAHGYDLIKALRERSGGARVAVLIVTQLAPDKVHTAYPVDGVFQKPIDPGVLAETLQKIGVAGAGRPVLVVDDDATVRRLVEAHLRTLGYRAVMAADGAQALDAIVRDPPALIVLDLVMPKMDGFAFLDAYRAAGGNAPVLVWTSKDLTAEESARLRRQVQIVAYKAEGGSYALANTLEEALRRR